MKIYLVIKSDACMNVPDAVPFYDSKKAIAYAKDLIRSFSFASDFEESDFEGFLYFCNYSWGEKSIHVVEKEIR